MRWQFANLSAANKCLLTFFPVSYPYLVGAATRPISRGGILRSSATSAATSTHALQTTPD